MKCLYISNPMSGNGKKNNNKIIERLKEKYEVVDFVETQYKSHIIDILNEKYKEYDTVVVTGGDGTLNETVNALAEKENAPKIGYIPSGTCNDVARSLNIPKNVDKALDIILKDNVLEYDIMKVNGSYCIYVCGIGIFTSTSYDTKQNAKRKMGRIAYFFGGIKEALSGKTFEVEFESDELNYKGFASLLLFINSKSVAGFKLNKEAKLNDGKVDVVLFCEKNKRKFVSLMGKIRIAKMFLFGYKKLKNSKKIKVASVDYAKVKSCMCINQDGECGECSDFELKVIQKGVKIIC